MSLTVASFPKEHFESLLEVFDYSLAHMRGGLAFRYFLVVVRLVHDRPELVAPMAQESPGHDPVACALGAVLVPNRQAEGLDALVAGQPPSHHCVQSTALDTRPVTGLDMNGAGHLSLRLRCICGQLRPHRPTSGSGVPALTAPSDG